MGVNAQKDRRCIMICVQYFSSCSPVVLYAVQNGRGIENASHHRVACTSFVTEISKEHKGVLPWNLSDSRAWGFTGLSKVKNICSPRLVNAMQILAVLSGKPKQVQQRMSEENHYLPFCWLSYLLFWWAGLSWTSLTERPVCCWS